MPLIAQLTDLHVTAGGALAYGRVDTLAHLRAAVAHLNALSPAPDAVIVTGDLVDAGTAAEYAVVRPELDRLNAPYLPIPGNHDGAAFWPAFADRMTASIEGIGHVAVVNGVRIVSLDTRVEGAAHGLVDEARAAWLADALAGDGPTLLAMHHPPIRTGIAHMDRIGLVGAGRLAEAVRAHPPLAIVCGHIHRTIHGSLAGVPVLVAPSPAHAVSFDLAPEAPATFHMEPPGVLLHGVMGDGVLTHLSFVGGHPGPYPFTGFDPNGSARG